MSVCVRGQALIPKLSIYLSWVDGDRSLMHYGTPWQISSISSVGPATLCQGKAHGRLSLQPTQPLCPCNGACCQPVLEISLCLRRLKHTHTHTHHLGCTNAHTCGFSQTTSSNVAALLKFLEEKSPQVIRIRSQLSLSSTKTKSSMEPNHDTHLTSTHTCNVWQDKRQTKTTVPRFGLDTNKLQRMNWITGINSSKN